jgi:hypothetical protein
MFVPCIEWCRVPFDRWPFIPHPQGHRPCFLDEAKCFVFYISPDRGLLHPRGPDSLYDFRPAVRLPYQWIRTFDFLCFSLSLGKSRDEDRDLPFFLPPLCSSVPLPLVAQRKSQNVFIRDPLFFLRTTCGEHSRTTNHELPTTNSPFRRSIKNAGV